MQNFYQVRSRIAAILIRLGPKLWNLYPALFKLLLRRVDRRIAFLYALHTSEDIINFIQVGSNDADVGDPLYPFLKTPKWHGIMVEPVDYVFKRLLKKHGNNKNLVFENIAIASTQQQKTFYYVEESHDVLPIWYDQLGSFSLETILKHESSIPRLRERIKHKEIPCLTFEDVCAKHNVHILDVVHIDTEGYDLIVLQLIDFQAHQPQVILFEHKHLDSYAQRASLSLLIKYRYEFIHIGGDTLAVASHMLVKNATLKREWEHLQNA